MLITRKILIIKKIIQKLSVLNFIFYIKTITFNIELDIYKTTLGC